MKVISYFPFAFPLIGRLSILIIVIVMKKAIKKVSNLLDGNEYKSRFYLCLLLMNNKQAPIRRSPPKLIILSNEQLQEGKKSSKLFRRCKKVIKTLHNSATPRFVDQVHIRSQFKDWMCKLNESKQPQPKDQHISNKSNTLDLSSERLYKLYNVLREDEKIIKGPSSESHRSIALKQASIKLNLREVEKMRCFESSKVALSPKEFQADISQRPVTNLSNRPAQLRHQRQLNSRRNLMGSSLHSKKRCMTERRELLTLTTLEKYLEHSPTTPLSSSKAEASPYTNRSKVKKIWETLGVHQWSNFN